MRWLHATLVVATFILAPAIARADLTATVTFCTNGRHTGLFRLVSLPYSQMAPDFADAISTGSDHACVQDPWGPSSADGVLDEIDVLCQIHWNAPQRGSVGIYQWSPDSCAWEGSWMTRSGVGQTDAYADRLDHAPDMGFHITNSIPAAVENVVTFSGPCDPAFPGRWIQPSPFCSSQAELLHFPYNARYLSADEILCGEKGVDWFDADGDGRPDSCPSGLFDGAHSISVSMYDGDHATQPTTDHQWITRSIIRNAFGAFFSGPSFPLQAGDAYRVNFGPQQAPVFWNPPTDPCS